MAVLKLYTEVLESGLELYFIKSDSMHGLRPSESELDFKTLGYALRLNALSMIKAAGSGHIGSSFSAVDLMLACRIFLPENPENIFFSSKGHDAPGLYAVMNSFGEIPDSLLLNLRRMEGLPGHPEVGSFGIPTSTGSLGMGISKAKGFWYSRKNLTSTVAVLLGDGELQEGQIWESLPGGSRDKMAGLIAIVDGNKIQSDTWVDKTLPLGDLRKRVEGSGWLYLECDGHDYSSLQKTFSRASSEITKPVFIYANTIKGSGVTFMESFDANGKFYKFHSGSPSDGDYMNAVHELLEKLQISPTLSSLNAPISISQKSYSSSEDFIPKTRNQSLIQIWAEILEELFEEDKSLVALDADLSYDTGTYKVAERFRSQYIQCGIAEQDMVSVAGTLALSGKIPLVHSFASFLTTRAAEQIFNNLSENSKVIYCGFLAGVLPSAPGHSHQAVSDFGIISSLPNIEIFEPACETEMSLMKSLIYESDKSIYLRVGSVDLPEKADPQMVKLGKMTQRKFGEKFAILTSGPSMTKIALEVANNSDDLDIAVFTYPTPGRSLTEEDASLLTSFQKVLVLENHLPSQGMYSHLLGRFQSSGSTLKLIRCGISELPKNGQTREVLKYHGMDAKSIAEALRN
jgi:transketolase